MKKGLLISKDFQRAMTELMKTRGAREEIPGKDQDKICAYIEQYMPFHARFVGLPHRAVDKALWAFGKFIGENNFPLEPIR